MLDDWHYCNPNGTPLTDEQIESYSYDKWINWLVDFTFADYPDQSERIKKISDIKKKTTPLKLQVYSSKRKKSNSNDD